MTRLRVPVLLLIVFGVLTTACSWPIWTLPSARATDNLDVEINYSGEFYHRVFNYSPDAANIRHYVMVMPSDVAARHDHPEWSFSHLDVQADGTLKMRRGDEDFNWALPYIFDAPGGSFSGEFEPGDYIVAGAFVAGPIDRDQAGAGDDAILWVGITGGGASSEAHPITIAYDAAKQVTITLTDNDGWACPWLYVFDGQTFQRRTEVLRNVRGAAQETTETTRIGAVTIVDGSIIVRLTEEKDESSYIDQFALVTSDGTVAAQADDATTTAQLASDDGNYLVLKKGDAVDLRFPAPASLQDGDAVSVVANGYYVPLKTGI